MTEQVRQPHRSWPAQQVLFVATVLSAAACVPIFTFILHHGVPPALGMGSSLQTVIIGVLLVVFFAWCELVPLKLEIRTETVLVGVFEFPLLIGLLFAPWWLVLGAQLIAGVAVFSIRNDQIRHSLLNITLVLVDYGVAVTVIVMFADQVGVNPTLWPFLVATSVFIGSFASTMIIYLVIRNSGSAATPMTMVWHNALAAAFVLLIGLVEFLLWRSGGLGPYLGTALLGVIVVSYLAIRSMTNRHATLNQLYTFIRAVGNMQTDTSQWPQLMEMVRAHNNARIAVLYLDDAKEFIDERDPGRLLALAVDTNGQVRVPRIAADDYLLGQSVHKGVIRFSADKGADPRVIAALEAREAKAVMVAALSVGGRVRGYVEVRDSLSRWGRFSEEDAEFLGTLSVHMATALENVQLLGNLRNEAYRDRITGLRSRSGLIVDAEAMLAKNRLGALVLVELDTLSQVNNALGHQHGEELLVQAGQRMLAASTTKRTVARLESDLFAVLIEPCTETELTAEVIAVLNAISPPYSLANVDVEAEPRAGIAVVGSHSGPDTDATGLLQRAEMALLASRGRHDRFEVFRPTMGEVYRRRFQLVTQFRQAVLAGHIVVYYQPKVSLRTQDLRGVEALVRWMHPEFGVVTPAEFVTAIEATGSIDILLDHVLDTVLRQVRAWLDRGMEISVAVNLSVRNLTGKHFPQRVGLLLEQFGVPARLLTFELTESSVMSDPETALPILDQLHAMGVTLSVDDFGTGYSSLAYLRRLPIDEIKIDRSFVLGMSTALGDLAIVQSIIELGHNLDLQVVAEGVEEESSRESLRAMRCDDMQGFLISRPQPLDRFESWLAARTVRTQREGSTVPTLRVVG